MRLRRLVLCVVFTVLLSACGSGPTRKVHPSTASIQQIVLQPDGHWRITLRLQNYSTFAMHYAGFDANLAIGGADAGQIKFVPDIDIVASNSDVVETSFAPAAGIKLGGDIAYTLKGTIRTSDPDKDFEFSTSSHLSPAPGLAGTWR